MDNQEAFDKALNGLRKQGKAGINQRGDCSYRTADGCRCGVGFLIPDEQYSSQFEGDTASSILPLVPALRPLSDDLLQSIQRLHDVSLAKASNSDEFQRGLENGFERIAKRLGLEYTPPKEGA